MKTIFNNNKITIIDVPNHEKQKISNLWDNVREDYLDWLESFRLKKIDNQTIAESLVWKGMSTWWLSSLTARDSEQDNRWLHRLMVLYLCKEYGENISIKTDDKLLEKSIDSNFSTVKIDREKKTQNSIRGKIKSNHPNLLNWLRLLVSFAKHLEVYFLLNEFKSKQLNKLAHTKTNVWFRSIYPANWVQDEDKKLMDRHIRHLPLLDHKYKSRSGYLMYVKRYSKDAGLGFLALWEKLRHIEHDAKRDVFFPEAHLSLTDIFETYYSSFKELRTIRRWTNSSEFMNCFVISGIDVSGVLLDEWCSGYFHKVQYNKLHGLAMVKFLSNFEKPQIITTYGEFFTQSRYAYCASKLVNSGCMFVALQHAMNVKNKMYDYYRKGEFSNTENSINNMPCPDYYLAQGEQYISILNKFYDKEKIKIVGCIKYDIFINVKKNIKTIKNRLMNKYKIKNETVIVLAPSIDDASEIFLIIKNISEFRSIKIMLRPHPATNVLDVKRLHSEICPDLNVDYIANEPTYNLFSIADLVVCGYSTVAIEAAYFGVRAVRANSLGAFPLFDKENLIPSFFSSSSFVEWYKNRCQTKSNLDDDTKEVKKLANKYFYKIDGKTADRVWDFLTTEESLISNSV